MKEEAMARALERFRAVLRERSLKMSKVRESIARTALSYDGHFSVDDLLNVLHERGVRDAHMATVYRAVPLLVHAGLIQPALVSKSDGSATRRRSSVSITTTWCVPNVVAWSNINPRHSRSCSVKLPSTTTSS